MSALSDRCDDPATRTVVFSVTTTRGRFVRAAACFVAGAVFASLTFHEIPHSPQQSPTVDWFRAHQAARVATLDFCSSDPGPMQFVPLACANARLAGLP